jgi:hypothetical protein
VLRADWFAREANTSNGATPATPTTRIEVAMTTSSNEKPRGTQCTLQLAIRDGTQQRSMNLTGNSGIDETATRMDARKLRQASFRVRQEVRQAISGSEICRLAPPCGAVVMAIRPL